MDTRYSFFLRLGLLLVDLYIANFSYLIGYLISHHTTDIDIPGNHTLTKVIVFNIGWIGLSALTRLYARSAVTKPQELFRRTTLTFVAHTAFFVLFLVLSGQPHFVYEFLPTASTTFLALLVARGFFVSYMKSLILKKVQMHTRTAILGHNQAGQKLAKYFITNQNMYTFEGFFEEGLETAGIEQYIQLAAAHNIREIYSTVIPGKQQLSRLMEIADDNCIRVKFIPDSLGGLHSEDYHIEYMDTIPVISMRPDPLSQRISNRVQKRIFDIAFSTLVILLILSWLTPLLCLLIKLDSKGPIFFKQRRSGRDNRPFWCYKFRSMRTNDACDHLQASRNDPRVTRLGAFLRKSNLDEMPQFFNVFMGQMSVVGPRPHMLKHTEEYRAIIRKYMARQFLQPGITGWAQVNGYRGETKTPEMMAKRVEYDLFYMENWSLVMDIRIICLTVLNLVRGDKNAF